MSAKTRKERPSVGSTRGRKRLPENERRQHRIEVYATNDEYAKLRAKAAKAKMELSVFCRTAIERAVIADGSALQERAKASDDLRYEWGRQGKNLNQVARWVATHASPSDALRILAVLARIEEQLDALLARWVSDDGQDGDDEV